MFRRLVRDIRDHADDLGRPGGGGSLPDWDIREPLVWAYCVLQSMPTTWRQDYKGLKEHSADRSGIEDSLHPLRMRHYQFAGLEAGPGVRLRWLASLVRALDADLAQQPFGPTGDAGEEWSTAKWKVPDYPCHVIPIDRSQRLRDGKPAERRSMRYHAIIPTAVGEYEVQLALHSAVRLEDSGVGPGGCRYASAIFEGLEIATRDRGTGFVVGSVECERHWDKLTDHVVQARRDGCHVLVWPELAVPAEAVERLSSKLAGESLGPAHKIPVIVAGSWHVPRRPNGRTYANRAVAMDGRGSLLFSYDKRMKFEHMGRHEAIEPGTRLPVLVTEDRLIAIGICLDFCDDCDSYVYPALDVDLVLVPSMGMRNTAEEHARKARTLQSLHETYVFVVQQVPVECGGSHPPGEPPGFSFVVPKATGAHAIEQSGPYRFLTGRDLNA